MDPPKIRIKDERGAKIKRNGINDKKVYKMGKITYRLKQSKINHPFHQPISQNY